MQARPIPFLVDQDNSGYFTASRPAVPQRYGDGCFSLAIGFVMSGAFFILPGLILLGINLSGITLLVLVIATLGAILFVVTNLRSGWQVLQSARAYRREARVLDGTLTAVTLVDEGGDYFLHGTYEFENPAGVSYTASFSHYRPDLVDKPLPPLGTAVKIMYVDPERFTVL